MKKILLILGTRPEAIKLAPLIIELKRWPAHFQVAVGLTGQHPDMAEDILKQFHILPDYVYTPKAPRSGLSALNAHLLKAGEYLIDRSGADIVVVQGDTASAFAGALAAFYRGIPLAHVEAGLRSGDLQNPFPEELNRILISRIASWHFAPTPLARDHLLKEGVAPDKILLSGNTGIDALQAGWAGMRAEQPHNLIPPYWGKPNVPYPLIAVTLHRRENLPLVEKICRDLRSLVEQEPLQIAFVLHPNPKAQGPVRKLFGDHARVSLYAPLSYFEFISLLDSSRLIITDSGGIQEEAPSLGKPVVVVRRCTERQELLDGHTALLCDPVSGDLVVSVRKALAMKPTPGLANPFGDGQASRRIAEFLSRLFRN